MAQSMNGLDETKRLLGAINANIKQQPIPNFPDAEIYGNLELMPEFKQLVILSSSNWQAALSNLLMVAPNRESKVILLHSFAELSPSDYLVCANKTLDLLTEKKVGTDEFLYIILMSPNQKKWFWSYNYENPEVIQFLNRVKSVFASDKNIPSLVDFILSGKAKKRDEILRKENPYYAKQPISLLGGPATSSETSSQVVSQTNFTTAPAAAASTSQVPIVAPNPVKSSANWPLIGGIALAVLAAGAVAWKYLRR